MTCFNCLSVLGHEPTHQEFLRCSSCGIVLNTAYHTLSYTDSYFTDEYEAQYGKSYEDDFDAIYNYSQSRCSKIKKLLPEKERYSLLDIGCALGFFMKAFSDTVEAEVEGVEISGYAAKYCKKKFGFNVYQEAFQNFNSKKSYDIITSWFYIEHNFYPEKILRTMYKLLNSGGVFAFSLPSAFGPMRLFHRDEFYRTHPHDHRVDFTPRSIKMILGRIGFRDIRVVPASYHPERIIASSDPLHALLAPLYKMYCDISGFGDTIEVYCRK